MESIEASLPAASCRICVPITYGPLADINSVYVAQTVISTLVLRWSILSALASTPSLGPISLLFSTYNLLSAATLLLVSCLPATWAASNASAAACWAVLLHGPSGLGGRYW